MELTLYYKCVNCGLLVRTDKVSVTNNDSIGATYNIFNHYKDRIETHNCSGNDKIYGRVILTGISEQ